MFDANTLELSSTKKLDSNTLKYTVGLVKWNWKLSDYSDPLSLTVTSKLTSQVITVSTEIINFFFRKGSNSFIYEVKFMGSFKN